MFRYEIYVTSLITVLVACLHEHKAISENDKKYWLRDEQFWPSIQKYRNLLKKSKVGVDTNHEASNILPISRKHQRDQEGLGMQVNIRPRFRVNIDAEQRGHYHGDHDGREHDVADVVHSRESYIRSQASQTLKTPEPTPKIDENPKVLFANKNGNDLHNFNNGLSQSENKENENHKLYQLRAKIHINGKHAEKSKSSNSFLTKKKRFYSEEKIQYKVANVGRTQRWEETIRTRSRGRKKKGRDFDRYKKERDFERDEQTLDYESKEGSKNNHLNSETRINLDRSKAERGLYKKEQKIYKKEKFGLKNHHRLSEERQFDRYKEEKNKKKQHDKEQSRKPNLLREDEPDYEREKYNKRVYVTKGYNEHEEPFSDKDESYESIEISSEEQKQQTNFHKTKKSTAVTYPRYPQINTHSMWPSLRKGESNHDEEFTPSSIAQQLSSLKKKFKEAIIEQEVIGRTSGGNEIVLWKIQEKRSHRFRRSKKKYVDEPPEKKIVFIVHGLSVMGWHELDCLSKPKRFSTLLNYYLENLDSFDIYLIPMANPDGVGKTRDDKLWNKNTSPQYACSGVNLDRNFDVHWNATHGRNMSSCHQKYPGQKAFSEHETRSVREVFHRYGHKIVAYFHVHAGTYDTSVFKGDAVLYPRGYMVQQTEDDKYVDMKADIDEAMRNTSFKTLSVAVDTLHNWYGEVFGTSVDYASTVIGIPYSLELVMQVYKDSPQVKNPDNREKNAALVEIWQNLIDVIFDSIYRNAIKPIEP